MFIYLSLQVLLEVETLVFLEFSLPLPEKIKLVDFFCYKKCYRDRLLVKYRFIMQVYYSR